MLERGLFHFANLIELKYLLVNSITQLESLKN